MKYFSLIVLFTLTSLFNDRLSAQTQTIVPDQRIVDAYGSQQTNTLLVQAPERIAYLNFFLDNSYIIKDSPYSIGEKIEKVSNVPLNTKYTNHASPPIFDTKNFNVLLYNFKRNRKIKTQYRIDNTDKVIIFFSEKEITDAFNLKK